MDELASAEATLSVLQGVLTPLTPDDLAKQTPCREFDVVGLTDHLLNSITTLGGAVGAEFPDRDRSDSVHHQVMAAARPAMAAWQQRGLDGTVDFGPGPFPATVAAGILSVEFLVHAWDYAAATGHEVDVDDELATYVELLAHGIITPEGRASAGFDQPVELGADAGAFERLVAFTGRRAVG
jgi:uncharacterized protein (TIGR03086 family)